MSFSDFWKKLLEFFSSGTSDQPDTDPDQDQPDPDPGPEQVSIVGTQWYRGGKAWRVIGKSIDWAVQPHSFNDFKALVDADSKLGINLYFAYAGPGLGKPLYSSNSGGAPYTDNGTLTRNAKYWDEVVNRAVYANNKGITVVVANTFPDQGVLTKYTTSALDSDWRSTVKALKDRSAIFLPFSEYGEGGNAGTAMAKQLCLTTKAECPTAVVGIHANKTSSPLLASTDFVCHQGYNLTLVKRELALGKPVVVAEHQGATDAAVMSCFSECECVGATYIVTGRNNISSNTTMSDTLKTWLKSLSK